MFANKRTGGAAASGKNKQAKHTGPAAARAGKSVDVQDGKSRFLQKAPAVLLDAPLINCRLDHSGRIGLLAVSTGCVRERQAVRGRPAMYAW